MRYLIYDGNLVSMEQLPAKLTREEAEQVCTRVNELRRISNEKHETWAYSGRGSTFLRPRKYDNFLTIQEIE